jgi:hypothetical protein
MKYLREHKKNIISEKRSKVKGKFKPGHIIRFSYSGKNVHDKNPYVLYLGKDKKNLLHGLNINYVSEDQLQTIIKITGETLTKRSKFLDKLRLPFFKVDISNSQKFYYSRLKKVLKSKITNSVYRTYKMKEIKSVKIIDYRFHQEFWKKNKK